VPFDASDKIQAPTGVKTSNRSTNPAVVVVLFVLGVIVAAILTFVSSVFAALSATPDQIVSGRFSGVAFLFAQLFPVLMGLFCLALLILTFRKLARPNAKSKAFLLGMLGVSVIATFQRLNTRDTLGLLLTKSAALGNKEAVAELLSFGARADYKLTAQGDLGLDGSETPVSAAVGCGQWDIAQTLVRAGAGKELPWALGVAAGIEIPTASAIGRANIQCVRPSQTETEKQKKNFLATQITRDLPLKAKNELLARFAYDANVESVRALFNVGADADGVGRAFFFDSDRPCLVIAARTRNADVVKLFLAQGVSSKVLADAIADSKGTLETPEYTREIVNLLKSAHPKN